jgi:hypothetical protein
MASDSLQRGKRHGKKRLRSKKRNTKANKEKEDKKYTASFRAVIVKQIKI